MNNLEQIAVIQTLASAIDFEYLKSWAVKLTVGELLEKAISDSRK